MRERDLKPENAILVGDLTANILVLRHDGRELADADRKDLLTRARAGEVMAIDFDARTFIQREAPNRNHVRIRDGALTRMARSFKDQPFLRDHERWSLDARGGTILSSGLVRNDGEAAFEMTLRAVKPWAVEGVLDGTIDRFSIGFIPTGPVICSVHKTPVWKDCRCWPGDKVDGKAVEFIFTEAEGVEVSGVNVPAVTGTGISEIRGALAALLGGPPQEETTMKSVLVKLGLPEGASEAEALAAVERSQGELVELAAIRQRLQLAEGQLAEVEVGRKRDRAARLDGEIDQLYQTGRLPLARDATGNRIAHPLESSLRAMAEQDYTRFSAFIADMPAHVPVGPLQSQTKPPPAAPGADGTHVHRTAARFGVDPTGLQRQLRRMGITDEQLAKYGPELGEEG